MSMAREVEKLRAEHASGDARPWSAGNVILCHSFSFLLILLTNKRKDVSVVLVSTILILINCLMQLMCFIPCFLHKEMYIKHDASQLLLKKNLDE